jgi:hypothetical protein
VSSNNWNIGVEVVIHARTYMGRKSLTVPVTTENARYKTSLQSAASDIIRKRKWRSMGVKKNVSIKITGQVPDDYDDRDYSVLRAKLGVICAEYDLSLEEDAD